MPSNSPSVPVAQLVGVSKAFGQTQAVREASLSFEAGRVHCLLGENGAGKSTVGKLLGGLYRPDAGEIRLDGQAASLRGVADARRLGVAMVFQELSVLPDLAVYENVWLGTERIRHPLSRLRRADEIAACRDLFARFGVQIDVLQPAGTLSVANQQIVEVMKAVARRPRLLILDEPTAMLGVDDRERLLAIVRRMRDEQVAVVFVTHHVEEVLAVADTVSLMKDGRLVRSFDLAPGTRAQDIVALLSGSASAAPAQSSAVQGAAGRPLVRIAGLKARRGALAALELRPGEVAGLYGVVGCGRERIAHALAGLHDLGDGTIVFDGGPFRPRSPAAALRAGVAYLPAGRAANCILPARSIRENLSLARAHRHGRAGVLNRRSEKQAALAALAAVKTRYADLEDPITSLSGGNQQKVVLGRCLAGGSRLLVLEDPTAGVDIAAKQDIHRLLREQVARTGLAVLLVSSDLPETIALCDVIYTVIDGEIVNAYRPPSADDEAAIVADVLGRRHEPDEVPAP